MKNHPMKHTIHASALLLSFLFASGLAKGQQAQPPLVIDSFKAGPYSIALATDDVLVSATQSGDKQELLGGSRLVNLHITSADRQPGSVRVLTTRPALIVNAGYHVYPAPQIVYKVPAGSVNLMSKYDRFLIDFDGLDHGLEMDITVFDNHSHDLPYTADQCKFTPPPDGPFTLSIPFSRVPGPDVLKHTTNIAFTFQPTSWGVDYAVTRIASAKGDPGGRRIVACLR